MELAFERRGTGSPLVLLHGIGHRWQAWEPVLDRLADQHEVIAVDLPGFGESPPFPSGRSTSMPDLVDLIDQTLGELGVPRPHVAGNSLGGGVALELAARGTVASATALSPAGFWTAPELRWAMAALRSIHSAARGPERAKRAIAHRRPLRAAAGGLLYGRPGAQDPDALIGDMRSMVRASAFDPMARAALTYSFDPTALCAPTTIAWGTRDRILLPRQASRAAAQLPDAWHVSLPGCGHVPMNDAPELVARTILRTAEAAEHGGSREESTPTG